MRQECINAVQQAASRRLTQQEIKNIEDRIYRNMRQLARTRREELLRQRHDREDAPVP